MAKKKMLITLKPIWNVPEILIFNFFIITMAKPAGKRSAKANTIKLYCGN